MNRPKFRPQIDFYERGAVLIKNWERIGHKIFPSTHLTQIKDDSDNRFLEAAQAGHADYLVTGNTKHFPMGPFGETLIVTPAQFCEVVKI